MGWWTDHVVPRCTDRALDTPEVRALRASATRGLAGRVLEIGFGSGLNLPHLAGSVASVVSVDAVDAVEPSDLAWSRSAARREAAEAAGITVARVGVDGAAVDAGDATYDAVLCTFSLCTIPDVERALAEVRRVLVPGGSFHFLEHGRSPDPGTARWQRRLEPLQRRVAGGCHLTRDPVALVSAAGLEVEAVDVGYLPGPALARPWSYRYVGRAHAPELAA